MDAFDRSIDVHISRLRQKLGPAAGYGDFEHHEELATLFGLNFTFSGEHRQSQPGTEDIQNSQIRLSDGTVLFTPRAFDTDGRVDKADYYMASFDAGMKYRGFALEGEYYTRWVDNFDTDGEVPEDDLFESLRAGDASIHTGEIHLVSLDEFIL